MTGRDDQPEVEPTPQEEERPSPQAAVSPRSAVPWGLATFLILAVALVIFAVQNTQDVELRFLGWAGEFPLAIVIISVAVVTVVLDEALGAVMRRRRRRRHSERQELRRLRSERGD